MHLLLLSYLLSSLFPLMYMCLLSHLQLRILFLRPCFSRCGILSLSTSGLAYLLSHTHHSFIHFTLLMISCTMHAHLLSPSVAVSVSLFHLFRLTFFLFLLFYLLCLMYMHICLYCCLLDSVFKIRPISASSCTLLSSSLFLFSSAPYLVLKLLFFLRLSANSSITRTCTRLLLLPLLGKFTFLVVLFRLRYYQR